MGTKFQCAINPLAENRKNISFSVGGLDDWDYFKGQKQGRKKSTVFINFEDSMDKLLEKENVEFVTRTMMTQENIFKHQVRELHRLYNTQKILMDETRRNEFKLKASNFNPIKNETKDHHSGHIIEDNNPMTKGFDLKRFVTDEKGQFIAQSSQIPRLSTWGGSDISATIRVVDEDEDQRLTQRIHKPSMYISMEKNSSSKDGDGYEECDVDLKLGTGSKKQQLKTEGSSSSSSSHKQSNLPHWLHQSFGSNKT